MGLDPAVKKTWIEIQKQHSVPVNAIGVKIDTNDNMNDFDSGCITPGGANIAGTGDCSLTSAVPLPAAAWLFGFGLAGLLGVARRQG